ncbi:YdjY domain-containing protein [Radiobacillus deserti]|uniref:4Fe-4S ferredoxin-type domain-containing protein n=1 Tax=Radiobacillus deserti TaxID=2594883 RepID=A0A516KLE6_9BACI|nr:YdjY domain-containing protein [Radiobacillus deserti]QDP42212.1 hypothetical protein FN924_14800 [Radiobacillus deserti]
MKRKLFISYTLMLLTFGILAGCGSENTANNAEQEKDIEKYFASNESEFGKEHSIYLDQEKRQVKVYATVNGKYLEKPTRHGLNWIEGSNGKKSVFDAYANPLAFYQALMEIGGTPALEKGGDKEEAFRENEEGKFIKGDKVEVQITWENADEIYDINEVMVDSTGKKIAYHFGGNYEAAKDKMTGCFMCFDSCPVGIISNASQPVGTFKNGKAEFHGNPEVLPEDGTPVTLIYQF